MEIQMLTNRGGGSREIKREREEAETQYSEEREMEEVRRAETPQNISRTEQAVPEKDLRGVKVK